MTHALAFLSGGIIGLIGMALICQRAVTKHYQEWNHPAPEPKQETPPWQQQKERLKI